MIVGRCRVELAFPGNGNLKDKRRVVKSLVDRARRKFNVAVAEVDRLDSHDRITLGVAVVTNEGAHADRMLAEVVRWLGSNSEAVLCDYGVEIG
ncbi:MAG: DUF503 domain-containing protein [bacterium]|nr:DUF503 domain-containing protein [bacterium]